MLTDSQADLYREVRRKPIRQALLPYQWVYSTNYDLLVYWAIMLDPSGFKDFLWGNQGLFDLGDTTVSSKATRVLYLHGGLHLEVTNDGWTRKRHATNQNLLTTFTQATDARPLFVSEGSWEDKMKVIRSSDYLAFTYSQLASHHGPLVVFGHRLSQDEDEHLVRAIERSGTQTVAISVHSLAGNELIEFKASMSKRLPGKELLFYRSQSHALGDTGLLVQDVSE
ncbi:MAG: DUF4917 family protein [Actinomycetota bacterium]